LWKVGQANESYTNNCVESLAKGKGLRLPSRKKRNYNKFTMDSLLATPKYVEIYI
jgi:hypothetical protein